MSESTAACSWTLDPQATAGYVHAYREMWDDEAQDDSDEEAP